MSKSRWSLQDAKNKFSAVVDAAVTGEPQTVTKRGVPAVVVVSAERFEEMRRIEKQGAKSFVDHLLAMPRGGRVVPRAKLKLRDVEL